MNKHSPGPWRLGDGYNDSGGPIAFLMDRDGNEVIEEMHGCAAADERLIVAAPEMLEVLRAANSYIDDLECKLDIGSLPPMGLRAKISALLKRIDNEP